MRRCCGCRYPSFACAFAPVALKRVIALSTRLALRARWCGRRTAPRIEHGIDDLEHGALIGWQILLHAAEPLQEPRGLRRGPFAMSRLVCGSMTVTVSSPHARVLLPAPMNSILDQHRAAVLRLAAEHGATDVRVFGSVARGEADEASDIDFLVRMSPGRSLFDLGALLMDLQDLLGCRVDVVTERGLRPRMRERVLRDAIPI